MTIDDTSPTDPAPPTPFVLATLRRGSTHRDLVELLQAFLRGRDVYHGAVDGDFGTGTEHAVMAFQDGASLRPDGVVGNGTWGALMHAGLTLLPSEAREDDRNGPNWPPRPRDLSPLNSAQRGVMFGTFTATPSPTQGNPEGIVISDRSSDYRIVEVQCDALRGVAGFPGSGKVLLHAKAAGPFQSLITAWEAAGLLPKILSWGGSYAPRFVRGSRTVLSAHSQGTAWDCNVQWNGLAQQPALTGRRGSVRELVPLANAHGWYWGGHFGRPDGMHFELARVDS